jgi:hypothetical protein
MRFSTASTGLVIMSTSALRLALIAGMAVGEEAMALQRRKLEQVDETSVQYDLSQFSVRFEKCQYVKMFDDDLAQEEGSLSPLALKHFVVYRLCPTSSCTSGCGSGPFGRYVTDIQTFLKDTIENQQQYLESMCQTCQQKCEDNENVNDDSFDCSCTQLCDRYENLADYGYVDASQYTECQQFEPNGNDDADYDESNGDGNVMYIGPRCNSGNQVTIGMFYDSNCWEPIENANVEELLGAKLSYHLLAQSYYANVRVCLTCKEMNYDDNDGENDADQQDADDVNEMCESLYTTAAKCESPTGLETGFIQTNNGEGNYENQIENEFMSCNFINSLIWNSYTQSGEINVGAPQDEILRYVTRNQKIALSFLGLFTLSSLAAMEYYRRKIGSMGQQLQFTSPSAHSVLT